MLLRVIGQWSGGFLHTVSLQSSADSYSFKEKLKCERHLLMMFSLLHSQVNQNNEIYGHCRPV